MEMASAGASCWAQAAQAAAACCWHRQPRMSWRVQRPQLHALSDQNPSGARWQSFRWAVKARKSFQVMPPLVLLMLLWLRCRGMSDLASGLLRSPPLGSHLHVYHRDRPPCVCRHLHASLPVEGGWANEPGAAALLLVLVLKLHC